MDLFDFTMSPAALYVLVLLAYAPGVGALIFLSKTWKFPILVTSFLGMLFFNALGSFNVFGDVRLYWLNFDPVDVGPELALILIMQATFFYLIAGVYIFCRFPPERVYLVEARDLLAIFLISLLILVVACFYFSETGTFLLVESVRGNLNTENALQFRNGFIYGLKNWPVYNLAFVFFPMVLASYGLVVYEVNKKFWPLFLWCVVLALLASLSMGSKGGVISFVLYFSLSYLSFLGFSGGNIFHIFSNRKFICFSIGAFLVLLIGYVRHTVDDVGLLVLLERIFYRMFVVYPESLAAALSYAAKEGLLGISVIPTARGLLDHEQANLPLLLHYYQSAAPGGVSTPFLAEAYLMSGWISVVIVVPLIFLLLVVLQEISFRATWGVASIAFSAIFSYLAVQLFMNGMFAAFLNFMYPAALLSLFFGILILDAFVGWVVGSGVKNKLGRIRNVELIG